MKDEVVMYYFRIIRGKNWVTFNKERYKQLDLSFNVFYFFIVQVN